MSVGPNCVVEKKLLLVQSKIQLLQVLGLEVEDLAVKVLAVEVDKEILKGNTTWVEDRFAKVGGGNPPSVTAGNLARGLGQE